MKENRKADPMPSARLGKPTPPMLINEISRLFHGRMRTFDTDGVMSQESARQIVRILSHGGGCSQLDLVHKTHLKPSTVSVCLKRLEGLGLVRRETDAEDMRIVRVYLSETGIAYDERIRQRLRAMDAELMRGFSEEESAALLQYLERVRNNILPEELKKHS